MVKATGAGHKDVRFNMIVILLSENGGHKGAYRIINLI
jgi:hypothetical protein